MFEIVDFLDPEVILLDRFSYWGEVYTIRLYWESLVVVSFE